jgi:hypothetical protein
VSSLSAIFVTRASLQTVNREGKRWQWYGAMDTERSLYCQREKYIVFREGNIVPCNGPYTTYPNKLFFVRSWCMMSFKFTGPGFLHTRGKYLYPLTRTIHIRGCCMVSFTFTEPGILHSRGRYVCPITRSSHTLSEISGSTSVYARFHGYLFTYLLYFVFIL